MISRRLELALERLQISDWGRFERIASAFLASEFDELRTVANPGGDEGRDAELFSPLGEPTVVLQYSVAVDWRAKINKTVRRLKDTMPGVLLLVYATNQVVGAEWDDLKKALRTKHGLSLDIRDRNWFVERVLGSAARQNAAEELATAIVDPYLASAGVGPHVQSELSSPEAVAAVTFLGLQWQDEVREKGLTKIAFEALVRAVLISTDSNNKLPRAAIHDSVAKLLPDHPQAQVTSLVDGALKRLAKHTVKHWSKDDEFCLAHEELQRLNEFRVEAALAENKLFEEVQRVAALQTAAFPLSEADLLDFATCLRNATDAVLFERSQAFAMAVHSGRLAELAESDFTQTLTSVIGKSKLRKVPGLDWPAKLRGAVRELLIGGNPSVQAHLRSLSDAYTLMAFLKQTPDVQGAVEKMFSHGSLWLDATVILPLIADTLAASDGERGRFSRMIEAAGDAGLKLYVTPGVVEEVERHMNRSLVCVRHTFGQWEGSVPYLLERYLAFGRSTASFPNWLENFRGDARPLQDIAEYLVDQFGISERSLEVERNAASPELRHALETIWYERYERRREKYGAPLDDMAVTRLVNHDVECYSGVVQLRKKENASPFGYSAWWLTVDRQAFDLKNRLRTYMSDSPPDSPVMSADFLVNYLAFGPMRKRVSKTKESNLPLLMVIGGATQLTPELIAEAENLRSKLKDLPERVVRRQIRDHLDKARSRIGPIANLGMDEVDDALQRVAGEPLRG
jgi:hypothetical protein